MPRVFINGKFIGGGESLALPPLHTVHAHQQGTSMPMIMVTTRDKHSLHTGDDTVVEKNRGKMGLGHAHKLGG